MNIYNERLLKLARFLRRLPKSRFNLATLVKIDNNQLPSKELAKNKDVDCKTVACAIGWCPVVFPNDCKYSNLYGIDKTFAVVLPKELHMHITPQNSTRFVFEWAERFFDLTEGDSSYLFLDSKYYQNKPGPVTVSRRIREFALAREATQYTI